MATDTAIPAYVFDDPTKEPFDNTRFYTPPEVIESGFVGRTTMYTKWLKFHILKHTKIGRLYKIWGRDLNDLWRKLLAQKGGA